MSDLRTQSKAENNQIMDLNYVAAYLPDNTSNFLK